MLVVAEKECFKCNVVKPLCGFYKHKQMKDGHLNKCKECAKSDSRNQEYRVEYEQRRNQLPHRKKARAEYQDKMKNDPEFKRRRRIYNMTYRLNHEIKKAAHTTWGNYRRDNNITCQPCVRCGHKVTEAHHEDYTQPFDIVWLCKPCHGERHREINYAIKVLGEDWSERGFNA